MPLRHLVFIDIVDDPKKVSEIREGLRVLSQQMRGCVGFHFARCGGGASYHCFFMDFADANCRDNYLTHPGHESLAKELILPNLQDGWKSVVVFDYAEDGNFNILRPSESDAAFGYVLMKEGQEREVLNELLGHCDKINHAKPLMNCSVEPVAKQYPYAMLLQFHKRHHGMQLKEGRLLEVNAEPSVEKELGSVIRSNL